MSKEEFVIFINYKPLTLFKDLHLIQGIYARWAIKLGAINIQIKYIKGKRNKQANALSYTIFPDQECKSNNILNSLRDILTNEDSKP